MKKINRIFAVLLVGVVGFSLCSCAERNTQEKVYFTSGVHDFTAEPIADKYFIKDGVCDYKIILPADSGAQERLAKEEFNTLFEMATNRILPVETDEGKVFSETDRYISIGETTLLKDAKIEVPYDELGMDGLIIKTKGNTVFLVGGSGYGTMYAVYDFMSIMFNYECYFTDCVEIDKNVQNAHLRNFDVKDIPDFTYRCKNYGFETAANNNLLYRFRVPYGFGTIMLPIHPQWKGESGRENLEIDKAVTGYTAHNTLRGYVPKSQYGTEHPKWYSDQGQQVCYTAHGDSAELDLMAQEFAMKIEASLKAYPKEEYPMLNIATVTIEDNNEICTCASCQASKEKYGTFSAACVIFTNMINRYVREWLEKEENAPYRREEFEILFFAYNGVTEAPASQTKDGFAPNAPEVVCDDGVAVWLAPVSTDYQQDFYSEKSRPYRENLQKWASLSDRIYFWNYSTNFSQMMYLFDSFSFYNTESYQYMRAHSGYMMFNQSQLNQMGVATAWNTLKAYLDAKLMWDCTLDSGQLIDNWFNAMFKEAAPEMKRLFTEMRLHQSKVNVDNNLYVASIYQKVASPENYPYKTLASWLGIIEEAFGKIEKYKAYDAELYNQLKAHIETEYLMPAYAMITLHADSLSQEKLVALKAEFKERALRLGITSTSEGGGLIEDLVKGW